MIFVKVAEYDIEQTFHKKRLTFAIIDGQLKSISNDSRSHFEWLSKDYGITLENFDNIIRGYVLNDGIYLYKGFQFNEVDDSEIESKVLIEIVQQANIYNKWQYKEYKVHSGMIQGVVGEVWKPKKELCTINIKDVQ